MSRSAFTHVFLMLLVVSCVDKRSPGAGRADQPTAPSEVNTPALDGFEETVVPVEDSVLSPDSVSDSDVPEALDTKPKPPDPCDLDSDGQYSEACGGLDCNDQSAAVFFGALEICANDVDEDCSGVADDADTDGDGFLAVDCGGKDCMDQQPSVHPGAKDYVDGFCTAQDQWEISEPSVGNHQGSFVSLAVDGLDRLHMAHYNKTPSRLVYTSNVSGSWASVIVDSGFNVGSNASLAVAKSGSVHISYMDMENYWLKYATNSGNQWKSVTVDMAGQIGWFSSIGLDLSGRRHVAYRDGKKKRLKYATCQLDCLTPASWEFAIVDAGGDVGKFSSLAITKAGKIIISYHDVTNGALKVATSVDVEPGWESQIIDQGVEMGWSTDVGLGPDDQPRVSYVDHGSGLLKLAAFTGNEWEKQAVAPLSYNVYIGQNTSIAVDKAGYTHIAFTDDVSPNLSYARCSVQCGALCCPGTWVVMSPDPTYGVGRFASLSLDSNQRIIIGYNNELHNSLNMAVAPCAESHWDDNCDGIDGIDYDGDGYASVLSGGTDCDDLNTAVNPGATDKSGDGKDTNCDGDPDA